MWLYTLYSHVFVFGTWVISSILRGMYFSSTRQAEWIHIILNIYFLYLYLSVFYISLWTRQADRIGPYNIFPQWMASCSICTGCGRGLSIPQWDIKKTKRQKRTLKVGWNGSFVLNMSSCKDRKFTQRSGSIMEAWKGAIINPENRERLFTV